MAEKKIKIELNEKEVRDIANSLRGWADTLVERYQIEKKPLTVTKKKAKKSIEELKKFGLFFYKDVLEKFR